MIAVDTSALLALLLNEPEADAIAGVLATGEPLVMSAATLAEALMLAHRRDVGPEMEMLVTGLGIMVEPLTAERAREVAAAFQVWGKGAHPARLNFGDCFTYATAKAAGGNLLFIGNDFSETDLVSVLTPT